MSAVNWNEANTFSKLTEPMLRGLGFPSRDDELCDEQTYVEKKGGGFGRYDVAYKSDRGILLLLEMKKKGKILDRSVENQALDYALGATFDPLPPPFLLVSNGDEDQWFRRIRNKDKTYKYIRCEKVKWRDALEERSSGDLVQELTLAQVIRLLQRVRAMVFEDVTERFFPKGYIFSKSELGNRRIAFERILNTRKSFVDPSLQSKNEENGIEAVVSSVALSLTLKILFLKILTNLAGRPFPFSIKTEIARLSPKYPDILRAEPYDVLEFSFECERKIYEMLSEVSVTESLIFEAQENPIGDIFDGLVKSEEHDLQVKSLGNVYTPSAIVKTMVARASKASGSWKNIKVLEPSCGSGHFVREVYGHMFNAYKPRRGNAASIIGAHKKALNNLLAIDIDPFAIQTTQLGMFLELNIFPGVWQSLKSTKGFSFRKVVRCGDYLNGKSSVAAKKFKPNLVIGNPPYGVSVTKEIEKKYQVESNDSYGVFIVKALEDLAAHGHLIFVVSSTFLLNKTHMSLRKRIFELASPNSVYLLHRKAFDRDVFCCLANFEKRKIERIDRSLYTYSYYDAWSVHPETDEYQSGLLAWSKGEAIPKNLSKLIGYNKVPVRYTQTRYIPPSTSTIDKFRTHTVGAEQKGLPRKLLFNVSTSSDTVAS